MTICQHKITAKMNEENSWKKKLLVLMLKSSSTVEWQIKKIFWEKIRLANCFDWRIVVLVDCHLILNWYNEENSANCLTWIACCSCCCCCCCRWYLITFLLEAFLKAKTNGNYALRMYRIKPINSKQKNFRIKEIVLNNRLTSRRKVKHSYKCFKKIEFVFHHSYCKRISVKEKVYFFQNYSWLSQQQIDKILSAFTIYKTHNDEHWRFFFCKFQKLNYPSVADLCSFYSENFESKKICNFLFEKWLEKFLRSYSFEGN